jgi:hypothetical protein
MGFFVAEHHSSSVGSWVGWLRRSAAHPWQAGAKADTWRMCVDLVADYELAGGQVEVLVLPADRTPPGEDEA